MNRKLKHRHVLLDKSTPCGGGQIGLTIVNCLYRCKLDKRHISTQYGIEN